MLGVLSTDGCFTGAESLNLLRREFEVRDFRDFAGCDDQTLLARCRAAEVLLTGWASPRLPDELAGDVGELR